MTIDKKIINKKLQCVINRGSGKISALWSVQITKYEYLTGKEILPSNKKQMTEQETFNIHHFDKHCKSKQEQLKIKEITKLRL